MYLKTSNENRIELRVDALIHMGITVKEVKYSDLINNFQMCCSLSISKQH